MTRQAKRFETTIKTSTFFYARESCAMTPQSVRGKNSWNSPKLAFTIILDWDLWIRSSISPRSWDWQKLGSGHTCSKVYMQLSSSRQPATHSIALPRSRRWTDGQDAGRKTDRQYWQTDSRQTPLIAIGLTHLAISNLWNHDHFEVWER